MLAQDAYSEELLCGQKQKILDTKEKKYGSPSNASHQLMTQPLMRRKKVWL